VLRYFTEWAMTIFTRGFSFDLVTRVWDVFLNEGMMIVVVMMIVMMVMMSV
jgi:hypothetical protein